MASAQIKTSKLERRFGYFCCDECSHSWKSAHVYCDPITQEAQYKQKCQKCLASNKPYKVEPIQCKTCRMTREHCQCPRPEHNDPKSFHKKDLCEKCLAGDTCTWSKYRDMDSVDDEEEDVYDYDKDDDYYNGYEEDNNYYEEDYYDDEDERDYYDDEDDRAYEAYEAWLQQFEEDFNI